MAGRVPSKLNCPRSVVTSPPTVTPARLVPLVPRPYKYAAAHASVVVEVHEALLHGISYT